MHFMDDFRQSVGSENPFIHHLIQTFDFTRSRTLHVIDRLTVEQLDFNFDDKSNSIGTLLMHIGALEYRYQKILFEDRMLDQEEKKFWEGALAGQLYLRIIYGNDLNFYIKLLEQVRAETVDRLSGKDDKWLFTLSKLSYTNYTCLFHLIEDEMNHVGQMKITKLRFT